MKIANIHIDHFGALANLDLTDLSPEITVFYGPNEAGKSTLLEFVRSVWFGFSEGRRRFIGDSPNGTPHGGWIEVDSALGKFRVDRHERGLAAANGLGTLRLTNADGAVQHDGILASLQGGVDEAIFQHVFAVGLREMQELGALGDTAAARFLFDLSAGLGHLALGDVFRELETSRVRLLGSGEDRPSLIDDLLSQRDRLRAEFDDLCARTPRRGRWPEQSESLRRDVDLAEKELKRCREQMLLLDLAAASRDAWRQHQDLERQIAAAPPTPELPANVLVRLERLSLIVRQSKKRLAAAVGAQRAAAGELAASQVNAALLRYAPRIEALAEQHAWANELEKRIQSLERELSQSESVSKPPVLPLVVPQSAAAPPPSQSTISPGQKARGWSYFKPLARRLKEARQKHQAAQAELEQHKSAEAAAPRKDEKPTRAPQDVVAEVERTGQLVAQLRRRIQLDDRLEQLGRQKKELDAETEANYDDVLLPPWLLIGLGGFFVTGVVLILVGLLFPTSITGRIGWWMALLGLAGTAVVGAFKWWLEQSAERHSEACHKQHTTVVQQTKQAQQERDELDQQLPKGGGALAARLQAAEAQLASLEEIVPLEARRQNSEQEGQTRRQRAEQAEAEYHKARQGWRKLLRAAGWDENLSPKEVAERTHETQRQAQEHERQRQAHLHEHQQVAAAWSAQRDALAAAEQIAVAKREELSQRRREWESLVERARQLLIEAGVFKAGQGAFEQLVAQRRALDEQRNLLSRRREIRRRLKKLRRSIALAQDALRQARRRRTALLRKAGVASYGELRRRAAERERLQQLQSQRDAIAHEIAAGLPAGVTPPMLHDAWNLAPESLAAQREQSQAQEHAAQQRQAALTRQLDDAAKQTQAHLQDRRWQRKQWELHCVEQKLAEAIERWQVLAVTNELLNATRGDYERRRQPETLREASGYFEQLTSGRYCRVWTPLDEAALRVDDAQGRTMPVENLSRGTREQLFLSLRLALVALFARRGTRLPLVLDDVLVNFDAGRAAAAAEVLRAFSAQGHQLLVFTCHEHLWKIFAEQGVDARYLPTAGETPFVPRSISTSLVSAVAPPPPAEAQPVAARRPRRERMKRAPQAEPVEIVMDESQLTPLDIDEDPERHRLDPPQEPSTIHFSRARWSAEEFDGELADWVAVRSAEGTMPPLAENHG